VVALTGQIAVRSAPVEIIRLDGSELTVAAQPAKRWLTRHGSSSDQWETELRCYVVSPLIRSRMSGKFE
jgi:hypothetical protein